MIKLFFLLICFGIHSSGAMALESPWSSADEMQARLISAVESIGDETQIEAALQIRQSPGWHSYWRSPGDSGLAPQFNWESSENIENVEVSYPVPRRFDEMGLTTFGYDGDPVFPLKITLKEPDTPATLNLLLATMVCKDICVPQTLKISLDIEKGDAKPSAHVPVIDFAKTKVPVIGDTDSLKIENIVVTENRVVINTYSSKGYDRSDMFLELGEFALTTTPEFQINNDDERKAMIVYDVPENIKKEFTHLPAPFAGVDITATLTNGKEAIEQTMIIR